MSYRQEFSVVMLYMVTGLLLGGVFFRQIVFSRFDLLLGDVGDARFNGVILEHWWQLATGSAAWLSPGFFYPVQGVLGYSDAGFLNAIPYIVLRALGTEPFTAHQIVLFFLVAAGWIGIGIFCRYCLRLGLLPSIIGAALFVFPNSLATSTGHTQLLIVFWLPYLAIGIYFWLRHLARQETGPSYAGCFLAIVTPAVFYTSYYIGWFFLLFCLLLSTVCYVWCASRSSARLVWRLSLGRRELWRQLCPYAVLAAVCFIPFLMTYLPVLRQFGSRGYEEIATMLPSLVDFINVGPHNWFWGRTLSAVFPGLESRPMAHELVKGMPVVSIVAFLTCSIYYLGYTRRVQWGRLIDGSDRLALLAAGLSASVLLSWLLMLKINDVSLWWLLLKGIPGAGGVRAVYRFQHVLAFPVALVVAIGLQQAMTFADEAFQSAAKRRFCLVAVFGLCCLLVAEQVNTAPVASYGKQQQQEFLRNIARPPATATVFALLPDSGTKKFPYEAQIDAMILAQQFGLPTVNGYSGQFPHGFDKMYHYGRPEYEQDLSRWIAKYRLKSDGLYFLDLKTGSWLPCGVQGGKGEN